MLIICNNFSTKNSKIKSAIDNKDASVFTDMVSEAKKLGFNALELDATDSENEAADLLYMVEQVENSDLTLILRIKNTTTYQDVIPKMKVSGIINPVRITVEQSIQVFNLLKELADDWKVLFTQNYGRDNVSTEIEGSKGIIAKAEQDGLLPERIWIEPLEEPLDSNNNSFIKMKRILDAFRNSYPDMNFYINLENAALGLKDRIDLINAFISMSVQIGVQAFSLDMDHKVHIDTINASTALLNQNGGISDYLK